MMKIFTADLVPFYLMNLDLADRYKVNEHIITLNCTILFTLTEKDWIDVYLENVGNKATKIIENKIGVSRIESEISRALYDKKFFIPMVKGEINKYFSFDTENDWGVQDPERNVFILKKKLYFALGDFLTEIMTDKNATWLRVRRSLANKYQLLFEIKSLHWAFPLCLYSADKHRDFEAIASKVAIELLYGNKKIKDRVKREHLLIDRSLKFEPEVKSRQGQIIFFVKSPLKFFLRKLTGFSLGKEYSYELGRITGGDVTATSKFLGSKFKL